YEVLTGGTDNHMVLLDMRPNGLTGAIAEGALEGCGIIVNKNRIPGETKPPGVTSGVRLGTNSLALRGMSAAEMPLCAELIDRVLTAVRPDGDRRYELSPVVAEEVRAEVERLCRIYP